MRVLFICNQNANRSRTAEVLFRGQFETRSAGLFNKLPVRKDELSWADTVVVMEDVQRAELVRRFPEQCLRKRLLSFDIPDVFSRDQPELVELLKAKAELL